MTRLRVARQQLVERDFAGNSGAAGKRVGDEVHLAFDRGGEDQLVAKIAFLIEQADQRGGQRSMLLPGSWLREHLRGGRGKQPVGLAGDPSRGEFARSAAASE